MAGYILTNTSIITCMHGGIVNHIPTVQTDYRVNGSLPMLMSDVYTIAGCSFGNGPCISVEWVLGSMNLIIKGIPALTHTSIGLCRSSGGAALPALVVSFQTDVLEPDEYTRIDY
jgi:hypothetical protein